jgi:hypothetical protein
MMPLRERHFRKALHEFVEHTTANAIIKDWTTSSSMATPPEWTLAGFAVVSD